jgi:LmbE family N-acetylglucosaminyl deacetylase
MVWKDLGEMKSLLVVAAHPDDELLGCGGTIALHARAGHRVTAVIVCEGESLRYGQEGVGQPQHARKAAETLGIHDLRMLGLPDQRLDRLSLVDIIEPLEAVIQQVRPTGIYTHHGGDINRDHKILFEALMVAARPVEPFIEAIYAFDTASSTEWGYPRSFAPDTWVDISSTLDIKLRAMACYESELRPYPHPRSLEALANRAKAWGNQNVMDAAEAFVTVRKICRDGRAPI